MATYLCEKKERVPKSFQAHNDFLLFEGIFSLFMSEILHMKGVLTSSLLEFGCGHMHPPPYSFHLIITPMWKKLCRRGE